MSAFPGTIKLRLLKSEGFSIPEGLSDRSLARSAWERSLSRIRPVGYGVVPPLIRKDEVRVAYKKL